MVGADSGEDFALLRHVDGVVADTDDKTVNYVYATNGQLQKVRAALTGGGVQETEYVFGVTPAMFKIRNWKVDQGSMFTDDDVFWQSLRTTLWFMSSAPIAIVLALGIAAGLSAVIVTIFYIIDDAFRQSFYGRTTWLWGFPPLVFLFICRTWLISVRGEMSDDPVEFALKDKHCRVLLALLLVCFGFAWLG